MDIQQKLDIQDTFRRFADREASFNDCCNAFFAALNVNLTAQSSEPLDFKEFYLERMNADTLPQYLENVYSQMQTTFFLGVITDQKLSGNPSDNDIQNLVHKDYTGFVLFGVELKDGKYTRTDLANITRGLNKISFDNPVIAFIRYGKSLTIAACERTNYQTERLTALRGEKIGKVSMLRDINLVKPHPGHLAVLQMMDFSACNTFNEVYEHWQKVFSTELLTDKFYKELYNWFIWAQDTGLDVYFPNNPDTEDDDRKDLEEKLIRLITRMIFVWFLKQKDNLVPQWIFNTQQLGGILKDFDPLSHTSGDYYNAVIQNLFFATLNKPINERRFIEAGVPKSSEFGIKPYFRDTTKPETDKILIPKEDYVKMFSSVPFLNGGLFECLDKIRYNDGKQYSETLYDGFSSNCKRFPSGRRHFVKRAFVPNVLFFGEGGLITLFQKYYFTVQENTPLEQDISLDPELLGKVFENLLGAYNPETKETVRKATGSYYTPQEIVTYMVNESITEYLAQDDTEKQKLSQILNYKTTEADFTGKEKEQLLSKLYDCKVFDPACGSGAFPMGMLSQMVHLLNVIDPENTIWRDTVLNKLEAEKQQRLDEIKNKKLEELQNIFDIKDEQGRTEKFNAVNNDYEQQRKAIERNFANQLMEPDYWRKLYIIQNCIFGSDIQKIAMQITKLRFFISLISEQKTDRTKDNFGISPMPNLETKFVCANTLLSSKMQQWRHNQKGTLGIVSDPELLKLKEDLFKKREEHFYVKDVSTKKQIERDEREICRQIKQHLTDSQTKPDQTLVNLWQSEIDKALAELPTVQEPKIVLKEIVTPGNLFGSGQEAKIERIDVNKRRRRELQNIIDDNRRLIDRERNKTADTEFSAAVDQITSWNPYDQNASAAFFDPDFMFNVQNGFDIVIGNPPYKLCQPSNTADEDLKYYKKHYVVASYKIDLFHLFFEKGIETLRKDGILSFITPNTYLTNKFIKPLRCFILKNCAIKKIVNHDKVFDASVDTATIIMKKGLSDVDIVDILKSSHFKFETITHKYQKDWLNDTEMVFNINKEGLTSLSKTVSLGEICNTYFGIQAYDRKSSISVTKLNENYLPMIDGSDVLSYQYAIPNLFFNFISENIKSGGDANVYAKKRIVIRQIGNTPIVGLCAEGILCSNTIFSVYTTNKQYDLLFIFGCLNSSFIKKHWQSMYSDNKALFPKIKGFQLKQLPIPAATSSQQTVIIGLVEKILSAKRLDPSADTTTEEKAIDKEVYRLYGLSKEEIAVVEGR